MLSLVPFEPAHFDTLASWFTNEMETVQWGGSDISFPVDHKQFSAMLEEGRTDPPTRLCWMAQDGQDLVGHAQLVLDWRNGNARLARVAVAPAMRGQSLAAPLIALVVDNAFAWPAIERLELNVFPFNAPAMRTYAKLGFVREGVRRSSARVGGERWDTVIMAILREDWRPGESD
ncbi:MAG: GNAT family N-acetyltransferase [Alphaproteobacteria bacterium]|nr:GNAT family N-acetyltransferase [Alphaproteobacteria bacterium]